MKTQAPNIPFFQVPTSPSTLSSGETFEAPVKYWDSQGVAAMFWVDFDATANLVKDIQVVAFPQNKALVTVAFFDYQKTTIGPYREVGLFVTVLPNNTETPDYPLLAAILPTEKRLVGQHTLNLPVTTELACRAGIERAGMPKFVTPIDFDLTLDSFDGAVHDPNGGKEPLVTLKGEFGALAPAPWPDMVILHQFKDRPFRVVFEFAKQQSGYLSLGGTLALDYSHTSDHPMAKNLRALKLQDHKPFFTTFIPDAYILFHPGAFID